MNSFLFCGRMSHRHGTILLVVRSAVVNSLDAVDIGEEVLVRVQVECGREDATNRQSNAHRGWHEDGMSAPLYTRHIGWLVLSHAGSMHIWLKCKSARHCGWHRNFQLSTRILHDVFEFLIIRISEVNTMQFSGIVELRFFDSPLWLFFALRRIRHIFPNLWPQSVWSGGRLFSCQSPARPCISIQWFSIQYGEPCETCPRIWQFSISINVTTIVDIFYQHDIQVVLVALVASMYFSGIRNDASLDTYSLSLGSTWWR